MNTQEIFTLIGKLIGRIEQDFADKKLTIDEIIGLVKEVVDDLGYGKKVILDLNKSKDKPAQ